MQFGTDGKATTSDDKQFMQEIADFTKGQHGQVETDPDEGYEYEDDDEAADGEEYDDDSYGQGEEYDQDETSIEEKKKPIAGKFKSVEDLAKAYAELEKKNTTDSQKLAETNARMDALYQRVGIDNGMPHEVGLAQTAFKQKLAAGVSQLRAYYQNKIDTHAMSPEEASYLLRGDEEKLHNALTQEHKQSEQAANNRIIGELKTEFTDALEIPAIKEAADYFAQDVIFNRKEVLDKQSFAKLISFGERVYKEGVARGIEEYKKSMGIKTKEAGIKKRLTTQASGNSRSDAGPQRLPNPRALSQKAFNSLSEKEFERLVIMESRGKRPTR